MIDKNHQKKGYGREAVKLALNFIKTFPCGEAEYCWLSYEPENEVASRLYRSFGFVETGEMDGEELIAILKTYPVWNNFISFYIAGSMQWGNKL